MMSMEATMHRMLSNGSDEARRLLYLSHLHSSAISGAREDALTVRRPTPETQHTQLQHNKATKRLNYSVGPTSIHHHPTAGPSTSVSRRNARERKRVRLVNLGFSNLRERVPSGTKNKKLSKVETLRAAIEYIRQLQCTLGMENYEFHQVQTDENFGPDDSSSVASSEEVRGQSADVSPVSSHPSECSVVSSPYGQQQHNDEQLMDIGLWFT